MKDIKKDLAKASELMNSYKNEEALEIYEKHYKENPEAFTKRDRVSYAWAIYRIHIKDNPDEYELYENAEFITELTEQDDLNRRNTCPYTFAVFKVMDLLKDQNDFYNLVYWIEKINPELLNQKRDKRNGRTVRSRKEKYFDYASKAYLETQDYELCIEVSKKALDSLFRFTNDSDTWHRWRIAKSLGQLGQHEEALDYLKEVIKVKQDWYIYKEMADDLTSLNKPEEALDYICEAVLAKGSND